MAQFDVVESGDVLASGTEFVFVAAALLKARREGRAVRVLYQEGSGFAQDLDRFEQDEHLESVADELRKLVGGL